MLCRREIENIPGFKSACLISAGIIPHHFKNEILQYGITRSLEKE